MRMKDLNRRQLLDLRRAAVAYVRWLLIAEAQMEFATRMLAGLVKRGASPLRLKRCEAAIEARRRIVIGLLEGKPMEGASRYLSIIGELDAMLSEVQSAMALAAIDAMLRDNAPTILRSPQKKSPVS